MSPTSRRRQLPRLTADAAARIRLSEADVRLVCRMQARVRGKQVRALLKSRGSVAELKHFLAALEALYALELKYVGQLGQLMESYYRPLMAVRKRGARCKARDIRAIFRNVEQLHHIHCNITFQLHAQLAKFPLRDDVGAFLMVQVSIIGGEYSRFVDGAALAKDTFLSLTQPKAPLAVFLREMATLDPAAQAAQAAANGVPSPSSSPSTPTTPTATSAATATTTTSSSSNNDGTTANTPRQVAGSPAPDVDPVATLFKLLQRPVSHLLAFAAALKTLFYAAPRTSADYDSLMNACAMMDAVAKVPYHHNANLLSLSLSLSDRWLDGWPTGWLTGWCIYSMSPRPFVATRTARS